MRYANYHHKQCMHNCTLDFFTEILNMQKLTVILQMQEQKQESPLKLHMLSKELIAFS
jgi:hypothetical protein